MCVNDQPLILAEVVEDMTLTTMDGILGLAFVGISKSDTTFLHGHHRQFSKHEFRLFVAQASC